MTALNCKRVIAALVIASVWVSPRMAYAQEAADVEQELFRLGNQARAQAGAPALEWNQWLSQAAQKHAEVMASRGELSHQFAGEAAVTQRLAATGLRFDASAENVALGETAQEIHEGWMKSRGHRENLLNPRYNAVGIGVVRRGSALYAVTDFAHRVPQLTASDVEDSVAAAVAQVRARAHLPRLRRAELPKLRQAACEMARKDQVQGAAAFRAAPQLSSSIAFTDADPKNFSQHVDKASARGEYGSFAVGACFERSPTYPNGTNWVLVGFF